MQNMQTKWVIIIIIAAIIIGYFLLAFFLRVIDNLNSEPVIPDIKENNANTAILQPEKQSYSYTDKEAFLVSDEDWRRVMTLIPSTVWTESKIVKKYPLLIYHKEGDNIDIDSIIHFISQYKPSKLIYFEDINPTTKALLQYYVPLEQRNESYWKSYDQAVYVADNYELSMMASSYASLINAPLIIENYNDNNLQNTGLICIGDVGADCRERYSLKELQKKYIEITGTDKIILASTSLDKFIYYTKSGYFSNYSSLFGKSSLIAPILASAKHEIIIPTSFYNYQQVDNQLKTSIRELNIDADYLTIIASPIEIEQIAYVDLPGQPDLNWNIDSSYYANLDNDILGFSELKVGRIYGFSTTDISSYLARDIFYNSLPKSTNHLFIGQAWESSGREARIYSSLFNKAGYSSAYTTISQPVKPEDFKNKALIYDTSHGSPISSSIFYNQIPYLDNTLYISSSCITCGFYNITYYPGLYCAELMKKGILGAIVATSDSGFMFDITRLNSLIYEDLGGSFKTYNNINHARNKWYYDYHKQNYDGLQADIYFLLGDPTIKPDFGNTILPEIKHQIDYGASQIIVNLEIPSINFQDNDIYPVLEDIQGIESASPTMIFARIGPINLFEQFKLESDDVDQGGYEDGIKFLAVQNDKSEKYLYVLIEKNLEDNPIEQIVSNNIQIRIIKS